MRRLLLPLLIASVFLLIFIKYVGFPAAAPAIMYFPDAEPSLNLNGQTKVNLYPETHVLSWQVQSHSSSPVYLLQNFSLLYRNNQLIKINNIWKRHAQSLRTIKKSEAQSGYYQSVSVHQAEVHEGEKIRGQEIFSSAQLFIMKKEGRWLAFTDQQWTETEKQDVGRLISGINQQQNALIQKAAKVYGFNPSNYRVQLLSDLNEADADNLFPGSPADSRRIAGQLWEGIYKTMIRGFEMGEGQYEPVIRSSLPILLIGRDHLLVLIESSANRVIMLKQSFN